MLKVKEMNAKIIKISEIEEIQSTKTGKKFLKVLFTIISGIKEVKNEVTQYDNEFIDLEFIKEVEKESERPYVKEKYNNYKKGDYVTVSGNLDIYAYINQQNEARYSISMLNPFIKHLEKEVEDTKTSIEEDINNFYKNNKES